MGKFFVVFALVFLTGASSASAQATRTWVSGVGDDANPCSRTAPCRTWAGAISKTFIGGEINALDPGGYGAVTITKSITLDGGGEHASILASSLTGVAVNIPAGNANDPNRRVVLRNIGINGAGASGTVGTSTGVNGVRIDSARAVHVEDVRIANFVQNGIDFTPVATNDASLVLDGVTIAETDGNGLTVAAANATQKLDVLVRNSSITGSRGTNGGPPGETGIGISADTGAHVWLTGTTIFDNLIGLKTFARSGSPGVIESYCDNQIGGNDDDGTPPHRLCPDPPVQTVVVPGPSPPPVVVTQTVQAPTPPVVVTQTVQAPTVCKVPGLKGLTIASAKRILKAAHCALGTVKRKKVKRERVGKVIAQKPRKGKSLAKGAKVTVTVGKR
jgi:PASTA domain